MSITILLFLFAKCFRLLFRKKYTSKIYFFFLFILFLRMIANLGKHERQIHILFIRKIGNTNQTKTAVLLLKQVGDGHHCILTIYFFYFCFDM